VPRSTEKYLNALFADAPSGSLIEVRHRVAAGMRCEFYDVHSRDAVAAVIGERSSLSDVYVGVIPRRRHGGGRADLVDTSRVLWADCDTPDAVAVLGTFPPTPSMVLASGTGNNRHAYWLLDAPVSIDTVERANRRLAWLLGADASCADAARILRPPSLNHKHRPPAAVRLEHCDVTDRYAIAAVIGDVDAGVAVRRRDRVFAAGDDDPLLSVPPCVYVERLAGAVVPRDRKIQCPFHDDATPSLHVYEHPRRGWYCFGCGRGGSIYDFAALVWELGTRGTDFCRLRDDLCVVFGPEDLVL
jgi:nitrite reductase/ring-hydroxylating ferredoxin subunit